MFLLPFELMKFIVSSQFEFDAEMFIFFNSKFIRDRQPVSPLLSIGKLVGAMFLFVIPIPLKTISVLLRTPFIIKALAPTSS